MLIWGMLLAGGSLILMGVVALVRTTLVIVTVEYQSMSPTLEHGDRVLAVRHWPSRWLRNGQIVLVWPWLPLPSSRGLFGEAPFIKRVVGMPGDTLVTSITELKEALRPQQLTAHDRDGRRTWHIPAGQCFVRGDYPIGGYDSLSWGPIPFQCVLGVVIMKLPRKAASTQSRVSSTERPAQAQPQER